MRTLSSGLACLVLLAVALLRMAQPSILEAPTGTLVSSAPLIHDQLPTTAVSSVDAASVEAARLTSAVVPEMAVEPQPINPPITASVPPRRFGAALPPFTSARQALVLDEASAGILYAKDADLRVAPASLTKIVTAIVAIEHGDIDRVVTVDVDSRTFRDSTLMGLLPGDKFTVRDLLYGLMLPSGNDAAVAIGRAVSGSDAAFVGEMNGLVARLGLQNSHFANPHGLDAANHYTSAYDIALLSRYAMTMPEFRTIVDAEGYTAAGSRTIKMGSLISGLLRFVPSADGVKSGFTDAAGRTLVLSATREGRRVYTVVMNDKEREQDGAKLLEWGFANHEWRTAVVAAAPAPTATAVATPDADIVRAARAVN